jgi:hypothetical protein
MSLRSAALEHRRQNYSGCEVPRVLRTASIIHKKLAAKPPIAKAITNDTDIDSLSSIVAL